LDIYYIYYSFEYLKYDFSIGYFTIDDLTTEYSYIYYENDWYMSLYFQIYLHYSYYIILNKRDCEKYNLKNEYYNMNNKIDNYRDLTQEEEIKLDKLIEEHNLESKFTMEKLVVEWVMLRMIDKINLALKWNKDTENQ